MSHTYQSDLDQCNTWKVELLNYANSLQDVIRAVNNKSVEQLGDDAVKAAEDLANFDRNTNTDYTDDKRDALKVLREVNIFADNLMKVIDTARENGWYRIELGYLKVDKDGVVIDRRIANPKKIIFKTGERIWKLITPATQW